MTLQLRKLLLVLQVMASVVPGHTIATSDGDNISLDSITSSLIQDQN